MSLTETLMDCVYSFPALYDPNHKDFKNIRKRDRVWEELGRQLKEPGEKLKKKWRNIRDTYAKYLKSLDPANKEAKKYYGNWHWAERMEMYKPFLTMAKTDIDYAPVTIEDFSNAEGEESHGGEDFLENLVNQQYTHEANVIIGGVEDRVDGVRKRPRKSTYENRVGKVARYLESEEKDDLDAVEHFMIGFAKTIKTFSLKRQTETKMELARLILQKEMEQIEEDGAATASPLPARRGRSK